MQSKLKLSLKRALKVARYLCENPKDGKVTEEDHEETRTNLIRKVQAEIPEYFIYNGFAVTSMINRIHGLIDGKAEEFEDDLMIEDDDNNDYLPIDQIFKVWRISGFPELDEELTDFVKFMAMRDSSSLRKVNYKKLAKIFYDDF